MRTKEEIEKELSQIYSAMGQTESEIRIRQAHIDKLFARSEDLQKEHLISLAQQKPNHDILKKQE